MRQRETEYHFLSVCPRYRGLRKMCFKPYYCHWPSVIKFDSLMSANSKKTICALS
jgi:hypothetical protein